MRILSSAMQAFFGLTVSVFAAGPGSVPSAAAQQVYSQQAVNSDSTDERVYAALFRRALLFEKMATVADRAGTPEAHLRRNLQTRFQLSDDDNASLLRYAQAWDVDRVPLLKQQARLRQQFRNMYPGGILPRGVRPAPPQELQGLQSEIDALTLHYRDLLRNAMRPADYDSLDSQVRQRISSAPGGGNSGNGAGNLSKEFPR